jgi:hypothetical protein
VANIEALNPAVTLEGQTAAFGEVRADSSIHAEFLFSIDSSLEDDPIELGFDLDVSAAPARLWHITFAVGGGEVTGLVDNFETGGEWSHGPATQERADAWGLTTARSYSGERSWGFSDGEGYPNLADGVLVSPPILLRPGSELSFFYWVRAESLGSSAAWDGGRVELSHKGGPWRALRPIDDYPFTVLEFGDTPLAGQGVFSGERDWKRVVADLSGYTGLVRLRFRFVSDSTVTREGWYIDDVVVTAKDYTAALRDVREAENGVVVEVDVIEVNGPYNGAGFNVYRRTGGPKLQGPIVSVPRGFAQLNSEALLPDTEGLVSYLDESVRWGDVFYYLVEDLGPAPGGIPSYLGPARIYLCLGSVEASLGAAFPNPFMPGGGRTAKIVVTLPDPRCEEQPSRVEIRIIDVAGRTVRVIPVGTLSPGNKVILWDGRDADGDVVPGGVYLLRAQVSGRVLGQKLVVIR